MDSAVTAALAARGHRLAFLHAELRPAHGGQGAGLLHALADHFRARAHAGGGLHRPRRDRRQQPDRRRIPVREGDPEPGRVPTSYVPFRNAHLLAAATSWAEVLGARAIFVGAVWEDSSGYPDCRPEFYRAFEEAIRLGTRPETRIRIVTPVIG